MKYVVKYKMDWDDEDRQPRFSEVEADGAENAVDALTTELKDAGLIVLALFGRL